jgi:formylglycine-generating enzyme required for sulfatase activity
VLDSIKRAARDWAANGKTTSWLAHSGERLRPAERLLARPDLAANLEPKEKDYLASCRRVEQAAQARARRRRLLGRGAIAAVLLPALIYGGWLAFPVVRLWPIFWPITTSVLTAQDEQTLKPGSEFKECASCPQMVVVRAGNFTMGSNELDDEKPPHRVTIGRPFAVGKFEMTWDEWEACVAHGGCKHEPEDRSWGRGKRPVINVSWDDAKQYVAWIAKLTGQQYRLLTGAEWEYAARAGTATTYSWGDGIVKGNANCNACGSQWDNKQTAPVGSFKPNEFGLYDMHGNVWEWVEDLWHESYEGAPIDGSAWVKDGDAAQRVVRGGSWVDDPRNLRGANRVRGTSDLRLDLLGFRLARTLNP